MRRHRHAEPDDADPVARHGARSSRIGAKASTITPASMETAPWHEVRRDEIGIAGAKALPLAVDDDVEDARLDDAALPVRMAVLRADRARLELEAHQHDRVVVAKHLALERPGPTVPSRSPRRRRRGLPCGSSRVSLSVLRRVYLKRPGSHSESPGM